MQEFTLTGFADEAAADLAGQIRALHANNMKYVELRMVDDVNIADFSPEMAADTARKLREAGIEVSCLGSPIGKISLSESFPGHQEKLRRLCASAHALRTDKIRIFSFFMSPGHTHEQCREEVIERLGRLLDIAAEEGCTLLHENERDIYGDTCERCLDLHRALGSRLRGILDPANYLLVGTDPLAAMRQLSPWIDYLHIKDVRLSDRRIVPAGEGDGSIQEILAIYQQKPGIRFLSVEPHLTHFAGRDKLEKDSTNTPGNDDSDGDFQYRDSRAAFAAAVRHCRRLAGMEV